MHPYRIAGIVLGALALALAIFLAVGLLLPGGWEVERSRLVPASPPDVYPWLVRAEAWGEWTPSPEAGVELFGPEEGVGSGRRWDDPGYGEGEFVVTHAVPDREVRYRVEVEGGAIVIHGRILLEEKEDGTRIVWREQGDFGWNPILGYIAGRMNELQGAQLQASLTRLEGLLTREGTEPGAPDR